MRKQTQSPKAQPYRRTPEERKAWWNSLSQEEKAAWVEKWENRRGSRRQAKTEATERLIANIKPLSPAEMDEINQTMRNLGLERFIVLPNSEER